MSWTIMAVSASKSSRRAVAVLGAVDGEVVEAERGVQRLERVGVARGEAVVEARHHRGFLGPLAGVLGHAGVQVVDHPVVGDGHVDDERAPSTSAMRSLRKRPSGPA